MSKYLKLEEFTKEQLIDQLSIGLIDIDFLCEYITTRDKTYNKLIDEMERLEKENQELKDWQTNKKAKSNEIAKRYYHNNKERIIERNKKYIETNREKIKQKATKSRHKRAAEFKAQGQMFYYMSKTERQNKMVAHLSRKKNIDPETSRKLLIENEWNIKKILGTQDMQKLIEKKD